MNSEKFARLAKRLASNPDRSDHGQLLPRLGAALEGSSGAKQVSAVVEAIRVERVIVPVPVEKHPDEAGEHRPQDLGPDAAVPLEVDGQGSDRAIVIFSSADQLREWDPQARPLAMDSQRVALTAASVGVPRLRLDPAGVNLLVPRPAVESLAAGDSWLPGWEDSALAQSLLEDARAHGSWASFVDVRVLPGPDGSLSVEVSAAPKSADPDAVRTSFAALLGVLGKNSKLAAATETVHFVPRLLSQT